MALLSENEKAYMAEMKAKDMEIKIMKMRLEQNQLMQRQMLDMMKMMKPGIAPTNLTQQTITFTSKQTQIKK